jgi:hypothetical protein
MFSLAITVSLIIFCIIFSGPLIFSLSRWTTISNKIIYTLSIITIISGLWFFSLPIPAIRYFGILSAILAYMAMTNRKGKQVQG